MHSQKLPMLSEPVDNWCQALEVVAMSGDVDAIKELRAVERECRVEELLKQMDDDELPIG